MRWTAAVRRAMAMGVALTCAWGVTPRATAQDEVIIETRAGGQNSEHYQEVAGNWFDSEAKAQLARLTPGAGSRFVQFSEPGLNAKAIFKPVVPAAGEWDIQVTWGRSGNAGPVSYIVQIGDQTNSIQLTQSGWGGAASPNGDLWHSLGVYDLPEGQSVQVTLDASSVTINPDEKNLWRVYADALRLVKPGSEAARMTSMASVAAPISASGTRLGESPFLTGQMSESAAPTSDAPFVTTPPESDSPFVSSTPSPAAPAISAPAVPAAPTGELVWLEDYRQAVTQGMQQGRPIVLFFHVPGQQQTQQLESTMLTDSAVRAAMQGYVLCKIRLGDNTRLDSHYKADQAPLLYFLNRSGISVARAVGVVGAGSLTQALNQYK